MSEKYDFSGWATRYNVKCSDGRTLLSGAFADDDGETVPLVWNHQHEGPENILGKAKLVHCAEGVKAFCQFNDTEGGRLGKQLVQHGDISALSIYANKLKEAARNVAHGRIREVSLVLASANPEAFIDSMSIAHADGSADEEAIIFLGKDEFELFAGEQELEHADKEEEKVAAEEKNGEGKTVEEIFDSIEKKVTPEEMETIYAVIGKAAESGEGDDDDDESEGKEMKHNIFDQDEVQGNFLTHADQREICELAKKTGSFRDAMNYYAEENGILMHADEGTTPTWGPVPVGGYSQDTTKDGNVTWLFPEYHDMNANKPPEMITDDWSWQEKVISKCQKVPFNRIRTNYVDIRKIDELRAKGYPRKGAYKSYSGNFTMARRTTDPQTIYIKNALHKDDINDITDFNYVDYLYKIDQQMLKNEIATAILFGDGRDEESEDKIFPDKIRPIWTDDDLYTMKAVLDLDEVRSRLNGTDTSKYFGDNYVLAEAFVEKLLYTREKFKGSGTPDLYITPHMINVMLLSRDRDGHRMYTNVNEIKAALNVNSIITIEQMENMTRKAGNKTMQLDAILVNRSDYAIGSTKGGQICLVRLPRSCSSVSR